MASPAPNADEQARVDAELAALPGRAVEPTPKRDIRPLTEFHRTFFQDLVQMDPVKLLEFAATAKPLDHPNGAFVFDCLQHAAAAICAEIAEKHELETHPRTILKILSHVGRFNKTYEHMDTKLLRRPFILHCLDLFLGFCHLCDDDEERGRMLNNPHADNLITELAVLLQWRVEHGDEEYRFRAIYKFVQREGLRGVARKLEQQDFFGK